VQLFQFVTGDHDQQNRTVSSDDTSSVVSSGSSSSRCCCHGDRLLSSAANGHCDSGMSSVLSDAAAASRIAEMEAELAQLRQQLALIVMEQERAADAGHLTLSVYHVSNTANVSALFICASVSVCAFRNS